jgi:hypothetical protein
MLSLTAVFLWFGHTLDRAAQLTAMAGLAVAFWAQGAHLQGRLNAWACLMVQAAVASTISSAWGWTAASLRSQTGHHVVRNHLDSCLSNYSKRQTICLFTKKAAIGCGRLVTAG